MAQGLEGIVPKDSGAIAHDLHPCVGYCCLLFACQGEEEMSVVAARQLASDAEGRFLVHREAHVHASLMERTLVD